MIVTVAMMWFRKKVATRKKKAVKSIQQYRKRRYIPRTPKVLKKYQESNWSKMLQLGRCQDPSSKDGKLFRRRFRIPYPLFLEIVEVVRNKNWFPEVDCTGAPSVPLELLCHTVDHTKRIIAATKGFNYLTCTQSVLPIHPGNPSLS